MVNKSIVYLVIALITLSITNLESKQPKSKYVAVLAWQNDSIRQTLYIKKKTSLKLHFKFVTENYTTKENLFILEGIARTTNLNEPRFGVIDECSYFSESEYGADGYEFNSKKRGYYYYKCTYTIFINPSNTRAKIVGQDECSYVPPWGWFLCFGTLRRIE